MQQEVCDVSISRHGVTPNDVMQMTSQEVYDVTTGFVQTLESPGKSWN